MKAAVRPSDAGAPEEPDSSDLHYIRTTGRADARTRVLMNGDTFAVFNRYGDIDPVGAGGQGLFHEGTRHLSRLELRLGSVEPLLLGSAVSGHNEVVTVDLTNPDITTDGGRQIVIPRGELHLLRSKLLWGSACHERLELSNYGLVPFAVTLRIDFDADFVDVFEVRGTERPRRGHRRPDQVGRDAVTLSYEGLDGVVRRTTFVVHPAPTRLSGSTAWFDVTLEPQRTSCIALTTACGSEAAPRVEAKGSVAGSASPASSPSPTGSGLAFEQALLALKGRSQERRGHQTAIETGNAQLTAWLEQSTADLEMMVTDTPHGPYPYAGVPWYGTIFGRDGLITALQLLWCNPSVARGVLSYLAAYQATELDPERDAEPGKILHEVRLGEMAALGEIPFGRYYGTADATPLFVLLAGAYFRRTGDHTLVADLWPAVDRALAWMDAADVDGDGFVEYQRQGTRGLAQQGWKDSHDSVFHADGRLAPSPIALCEIQGYVYAARLAAAEMAMALGNSQRAQALHAAAAALRTRFEEAFWCDDLSTYALALDGEKRPCRVRTSNAAHCLFTGIAGEVRARRTAETLLSDGSFSGWGIRTLDAGERRYNPMSYHNGSIWPHDNAIAALGLGRYGMRRLAGQLFESFLAAATFLDLHRLPELFCGFRRRTAEGPTIYPVACLPQAWASGAVFMFIEACLGLSIDARKRKVRFDRPFLPRGISWVRLRGLCVGDGSADVTLKGEGQDIAIRVVDRAGEVNVVVVK